ncbi:MAG TPA: flagellar biosynthesis anti-sigma factor FlgM [Firmicutes bacterium]|nr:flagellar biosynthesis anti-sigma factor FlgM [Bacillota bacterium]
MKVTNDVTRQVIQSYVDQVRRRRPGEGPAAESPSSGGDSLVLSSRAREFSRVKAMVDNVPDIREDKVNTIRARIAAGLYDVGGKRIAEKLLGEKVSREA